MSRWGIRQHLNWHNVSRLAGLCSGKDMTGVHLRSERAVLLKQKPFPQKFTQRRVVNLRFSVVALVPVLQTKRKPSTVWRQRHGVNMRMPETP